MMFEASDESHSLLMDAKPPFGQNKGFTPKELVMLGMGGCTAMDVIAYLKKFKQAPDSFFVETEVTPTTGGHPVVFEKAELFYVCDGQIDPEKLLEAVRLSQSKFCGVSAMLSKAFPITYRVELNGKEIGIGKAEF